MKHFEQTLATYLLKQLQNMQHPDLFLQTSICNNCNIPLKTSETLETYIFNIENGKAGDGSILVVAVGSGDERWRASTTSNSTNGAHGHHHHHQYQQHRSWLGERSLFGFGN
jgi:hypothetical protein